MAQFRGTLQGQRGETSRLGSKKSGLRARLAGWAGSVVVRLFSDEGGRDMATVTLEQGNEYGSGGPTITLYDGPIGATTRTAMATKERRPTTGPSDESIALDRITEVLSGREWNSDTTSYIAEIVRETGRTIADVE
jgi:hypothetical protein